MADAKKSETSKPAPTEKKAAEPAPAHHIRARLFAIEFLGLQYKVAMSQLTAEAKELLRYVLEKKPSSDEVDARILALKTVARAGIARSALVAKARDIETFILTGEATAKAAVPAAAGNEPADDPATTGSQVPAPAGEADEVRPRRGRPSERPGMGVLVEE